MAKTPPLDKAVLLKGVLDDIRTVNETLVPGDAPRTLIPGDKPISVPGEFVKLLLSMYPARSKTWAYDAAAVVASRPYVVWVKGVIGTMVSSGMNDVNNIQPAEQAARQAELKPLRRKWGADGGRPRKA